MSKTPRSPTESVASDFSDGSFFCGVGSPRPKPRLLSGTMFGHVEGAFDEKTLPIGYAHEKKFPSKSSPNGKESNGSKVGDEEAKNGEEVPTEDGKEGNAEQKNEVNEQKENNEGKKEGNEEKEVNGAKDHEDGQENDAATEEEKGPLPVSEAVSKIKAVKKIRDSRFGCRKKDLLHSSKLSEVSSLSVTV